MSRVALRFFKSPGFQTLNGEMAGKLGVSVSRKSIRRYVLDAAHKMRESLINELKGKLAFTKTEAATRQLRSFLGINIRYFDKNQGKSVVKMLTQKKTCQSANMQLNYCNNSALRKKMFFVW